MSDGSELLIALLQRIQHLDENCFCDEEAWCDLWHSEEFRQCQDWLKAKGTLPADRGKATQAEVEND